MGCSPLPERRARTIEFRDCISSGEIFDMSVAAAMTAETVNGDALSQEVATEVAARESRDSRAMRFLSAQEAKQPLWPCSFAHRLPAFRYCYAA